VHGIYLFWTDAKQACKQASKQSRTHSVLFPFLLGFSSLGLARLNSNLGQVLLLPQRFLWERRPFRPESK
jgi:hypothetical protein